jgi:organic hydroperoxide reductase OsmC/OhrA
MDIVHFYHIKIKWTKGKEGELSEPALPVIHTGIAPPFPGGVPDVWSPEQLFVASINSCLMTSFLTIAEKSIIPSPCSSQWERSFHITAIFNGINDMKENLIRAIKLATTRHSGEYRIEVRHKRRTRSEAFQRYPSGNIIGLDAGLRRYDVMRFPQLKSLV